MGTYVFRLPDVGEGVAEAEITAWHVAVGDRVEEDQPLVDVMTDKATVEIPSPVAGRIVALHGAAGDMRPVGAELVVVETAEPEAESGKPAGAKREAGRKKPAKERGAKEEKAPQRPVAAEAAAPQRRALAAPAVRRRAHDLGIDLASVTGTGPDGRVGHRDLDALLAAATGKASAMANTAEGVEEIRITGLRRRIAERMQEAKRRIPHFSYVEEVDIGAVQDLRRHLNESHGAERPRLSPLPFLMRALAIALADFPQINAHFDDEAGIVTRHRAVHIGIATQTEGGLLVPVVHHAEARDLWSCAGELHRLAEAARTGKAKREELAGSTITITSLGALGGLASTPVINRPEVAIIGVNRIQERPVVRDGRIAIRPMMNLSSSFDHRVVDGWDAAAFIQRVKGLLEQPAILFME